MTREEFILNFMIQRADQFNAEHGFCYQIAEDHRTPKERSIAAQFPGEVMTELSLATAVVECIDKYDEGEYFEDNK